MLSKQDVADVVVSVARPPCAGAGSLSRTKVGSLFVNSRIQDGVSVNSSGASSHACVSYFDALLSAPARAPAASVVARRASPSSAAVGLCMDDDGSHVHGACSDSWSDTGHALSSDVSGGFKLTQMSTSYSWEGCRVPWGTKGGVSGTPKICTLSQRWEQW